MNVWLLLLLLTAAVLCVASETTGGLDYEIVVKSSNEAGVENKGVVDKVVAWLREKKREVIDQYDDPEFKLVVANLDAATKQLMEQGGEGFPYKEQIKEIREDTWDMENFNEFSAGEL